MIGNLTLMIFHPSSRSRQLNSKNTQKTLAHEQTASAEATHIFHKQPTSAGTQAVQLSSNPATKVNRVATIQMGSQVAQMIPTSRVASPSRPSALDAEDNITFEEEYGEECPDMGPVLLRIYSGIRYSRAQLRKNLSIMQTTHFTIPLPPETPADGTALVLLRRAEEDGFVTFVLESSFYIVFELGMPIPYVVPEGAGVRLVHHPQWWVGKSTAEVKAGPHAEAKDVRRAEGNLKGLATRNEKKAVKSKRQREMERKLREGLRRQAANEKMCDSDEDGERVWSETETESKDDSESGEDDVGL